MARMFGSHRDMDVTVVEELFSFKFWTTRFFHYAQQLFMINPVERFLIVDNKSIYFSLTWTDLYIIVLSWNIASPVPLLFLNPIWLFDRCRSIIGVILELIRCSSIFEVCDIRLIVRKSAHSWVCCTFGTVMRIVYRKSSGIMQVL